MFAVSTQWLADVEGLPLASSPNNTTDVRIMLEMMPAHQEFSNGPVGKRKVQMHDAWCTINRLLHSMRQQPCIEHTLENHLKVRVENDA